VYRRRLMFATVTQKNAEDDPLLHLQLTLEKNLEILVVEQGFRKTQTKDKRS
jgi:hypothetical protein